MRNGLVKDAGRQDPRWAWPAVAGFVGIIVWLLLRPDFEAALVPGGGATILLVSSFVAFAIVPGLVALWAVLIAQRFARRAIRVGVRTR